HSLGDAHLYLNHLEQAETQLARKPQALPKLHIKRKVETLEDFVFEDFEITGYAPDAAIKAPVAV
ncbi:MAG: thymidylate synthase, partial [Aestuariivirga sp.]